MRNRLLSLFSGSGGLDLGFESAGYKTALACEADPAALHSHRMNLGSLERRSCTISESTVEEIARAAAEARVAGVIGGPPCQGFSTGNVRKHCDDPRNQMIFRFAEIVRVTHERHQLDFFLMENVSGLIKPRNEQLLNQLLDHFQDSGFSTQKTLVNAHNFGVPQTRERVFLIGLNRDRFGSPEIKLRQSRARKKTVRDAIGHLPEPVYFRRNLDQAHIPVHPNHWTMQPRSKRFEEGDFNRYRSFRRIHWDAPSPTVAYGNREIHVHPNGRRRLSICEALLLQGMPKKYALYGNFSEQVKQVSNLVPPALARAAASAINRVTLSTSTRK